jgi:hypothetical protein
MDQTKIFRQMMEFNKTAFDNSFKTMVAMQDQTEKLVSGFLEKAPWFPAEGKKTLNDWVNACKKGRDDFKAATDNGYNKVTDYFVNVSKEAPKAEKK